MGQGKKDSYLMLLWLLPKAPAGPEFTFHLIFDKWSAKINNSSIQFVDYADKNKHNSSA